MMDRYFDLLKEKQVVNHKINTHRKYLNEQYRRTHKKEIRFLDIAMIIIVICNFGAMFLTNYLVAKEVSESGQELVLEEANPVNAELHDMPTSKETNKGFFLFFKTLILWAVLGAIYLYYRGYIISNDGYYVMVAVVVLYFFLLVGDFMNNLGFFVGKVMFF